MVTHGPAPHTSSTTEFTTTFAATPEGARLARRVAVLRLVEWGYETDTPALLIGELTANAASHGLQHPTGHRLRISTSPGASPPAASGHAHSLDNRQTLRWPVCSRDEYDAASLLIEVADACAEQHPVVKPHVRSEEEESGRGMLLVALLSTAWGSFTHADSTGKTVWCQCPLTAATPSGLHTRSEHRLPPARDTHP